MFYLAFEVTRTVPESRNQQVDVFIMDKNNKVLFSYLKQEQGLIKVPIVNNKEHKVVFSNFKVNTSAANLPVGLVLSQVCLPRL